MPHPFAPFFRPRAPAAKHERRACHSVVAMALIAVCAGFGGAALAAEPANPAADTTTANDADTVGIVKQVTGTVSLHRRTVQQPLKEGEALRATDRIVSGPDGVAAIVFRDGTRLTLGSSTDVQMRRYAFEPKSEDYAFDMYLAKGRTIYASGKIGKLSPQSVKLDTPTATVGVRGTRLILEAE